MMRLLPAKIEPGWRPTPRWVLRCLGMYTLAGLLGALVVVLYAALLSLRAGAADSPPPQPVMVSPAMAALYDDLSAAETALRHAKEDAQRLVSEAVLRDWQKPAAKEPPTK